MRTTYLETEFGRFVVEVLSENTKTFIVQFICNIANRFYGHRTVRGKVIKIRKNRIRKDYIYNENIVLIEKAPNGADRLEVARKEVVRGAVEMTVFAVKRAGMEVSPNLRNRCPFGHYLSVSALAHRFRKAPAVLCLFRDWGRSFSECINEQAAWIQHRCQTVLGPRYSWCPYRGAYHRQI